MTNKCIKYKIFLLPFLNKFYIRYLNSCILIAKNNSIQFHTLKTQICMVLYFLYLFIFFKIYALFLLLRI